MKIILVQSIEDSLVLYKLCPSIACKLTQHWAPCPRSKLSSLKQ